MDNKLNIYKTDKWFTQSNPNVEDRIFSKVLLASEDRFKFLWIEVDDDYKLNYETSL